MKKIITFIRDLKLLVVLLVGAIAFMLSMRLVLGSKNEKQFHEIIWDSRAIVGELANNATKDTARTRAYVTNYLLPYETGKRQNIDSLLPSFRTAHLKALAGLQQKIAGMNDSLWDHFIETRLFLVPDSACVDCLDMDTAKRYCGSDRCCLGNVEIVYMDTAFPQKQMRYKTSLPVKVYNCPEDFLSKYPLFGIWALLLVIQVTLFSFFIPWLLQMLFWRSHDKDVKLIQLNRGVKLVYIVVIVLACMGLYHLLLPGGDNNVLVKRQYFMAGIDDVFEVANIMGYLTAGLCLAGIVFSLIEIDKADEDKVFSKEEIDYLESRFRHFLTIAGVLLSLAVFATGTFFSALNSLDFIRVISRSLGHSPVPNDYVLLYGLVHTFALLVFYIPARYKLDRLAMASGEKKVGEESWLPMKKLAQLAVVSSPLLAGLLQNLLEMFN